MCGAWHGSEPTGGLEPPTARLQVGCATSCATPADTGRRPGTSLGTPARLTGYRLSCPTASGTAPRSARTVAWTGAVATSTWRCTACSSWSDALCQRRGSTGSGSRGTCSGLPAARRATVHEDRRVAARRRLGGQPPGEPFGVAALQLVQRLLPPPDDRLARRRLQPPGQRGRGEQPLAAERRGRQLGDGGAQPRGAGVGPGTGAGDRPRGRLRSRPERCRTAGAVGGRRVRGHL